MYAILTNSFTKYMSLEKFIQVYGDKIVISVIILLVGYILIKVLMKMISKGLKKSKVDVTLHKFLLSVIKVVLWIVVFLTIMQTFEIPMTTIIASFSVLGLAISLAVKDSLSNVAGGLIVLFSKPFQVGDYIKIDEFEGKVVHINTIHTKLTTIDNKAIFIPNGSVSSDTIINFTNENMRRVDLIFSIGYNDDFKKAKKIICDIIDKHPNALKEPTPLVRVCELGPSSVNITTRVWAKGEDYWDLRYDLLETVKNKFDQERITIPYNQLDVHITNN